MFKTFDEFINEAKVNGQQIKKGQTVKIISAEEMDKQWPGMPKDLLKYNKKIAGKTVTIKRLFRGMGMHTGPITDFAVDGYPLYDKGVEDTGFDVDGIEKIIK